MLEYVCSARVVQYRLRQHHVGEKELDVPGTLLLSTSGPLLALPSLQDLPIKTLGTKKGVLHGLSTDLQQLLHPNHLCSGEGASNKYSSQLWPEARFIEHTTSVSEQRDC